MPTANVAFRLPESPDGLSSTLQLLTQLREASIEFDERHRTEDNCGCGEVQVSLPTYVLDVVIIDLESARCERDALITYYIRNQVFLAQRRRGQLVAWGLTLVAGIALLVGVLS